MGIYECDKNAVVGQGSSVLQYKRVNDAPVAVKPDLPGNVIVIHGVNDVGVSFDQVEQGLCAGLGKRVAWEQFQPGTYRMPTRDDNNQVLDDPDAVFFKRQLGEGHHTPVIPFYWGYKEDKNFAATGDTTTHGQSLDRFGNRLDKDLSKGGGPFANATGTLVDMWGAGKWGTWGILNALNGDPLRPVLANPGRMYMILAAQRLAALISMIRDYDPNEAVSLVAHSQGCMLSLLAQAFLMQKGLRPADTLVLTHPPYSLVDDVPFTADAMELREGDEDALMKGRYGGLAGGQTLHARLETLVRIVQGVAAARHSTPDLKELKLPSCRGMVGAKWMPDTPERDNRGKVYLYFCPEDMTVGLQNVQGIGWQGVPEFQTGKKLVQYPFPLNVSALDSVVRMPLAELGAGFFQRVFTGKKRPDRTAGQSVMVGQAAPHDFALRVEGESGFEHVDKMAMYKAGRHVRSALPVAQPPNSTNGPQPLQEQQAQRAGYRRITGEPLARPVAAHMYAGSISSKELPAELKGTPIGAYETVDPIDAAIASTQAKGYETVWQLVDDQLASNFNGRVNDALSKDGSDKDSPRPDVFKGKVRESDYKKYKVLEQINQGKPKEKHSSEVAAVYTCMDGHPLFPRATGKLLIARQETPEEARLRWQQRGTSERSFHGAIFGSKENHQNVTAYDIAIGGGKACSDASFYAYLCAVADWRLTMDPEAKRPGILKWDQFLKSHSQYFSVEPPWRKDLIFGNAKYYSSGALPTCLPVLPEGRPPALVCETMNKQHIGPLDPSKSAAPSYRRLRTAEAEHPATERQQVAQGDAEGRQA